jgi:NADPH2:quinone reductase
MDHGIDYRAQDLVAEVKRMTKGRGVDVVVDPVGGTTLQQSLASLAYRGRVSFVGRAGREDVKHDVSGLMAGNQSLTGVFLGAEIVTDRVHDMIQRHVDDVAKGALRVAVDSTFPLRDAAAAHRHIESRQAFGRVLLIP